MWMVQTKRLRKRLRLVSGHFRCFQLSEKDTEVTRVFSAPSVILVTSVSEARTNGGATATMLTLWVQEMITEISIVVILKK